MTRIERSLTWAFFLFAPGIILLAILTDFTVGRGDPLFADLVVAIPGVFFAVGLLKSIGEDARLADRVNAFLVDHDREPLSNQDWLKLDEELKTRLAFAFGDRSAPWIAVAVFLWAFESLIAGLMLLERLGCRCGGGGEPYLP